MALDTGSITVAITSMASSLELPESPFFFSSLNCFAIVSCVAPCTGRAKPQLLYPHQLHQDGPVTSFGRVKIQGPFAVTATVCSKCADGLPSAVSATHSSRIRTSGLTPFTTDSTPL